MDYEREIKRKSTEILNLSEEMDALVKRFNECSSLTSELLAKCMEKGITKVAIRRKHKSIPSSVDFPFGACTSIFTYQPKANKELNTSPPIWRIVEQLGVYSGCGNGDQAQIRGDASLLDGVYHVKKGQWVKVE